MYLTAPITSTPIVLFRIGEDIVQVINKQVVRINPYTDACTLCCPFLNNDSPHIAYCTRYKTQLNILTYQPNNAIRRAWNLFKINIKRFMVAKGRYRTNRIYIPFEHVYYEQLDKKTVRLYIRTAECKKDYETAELIGYIVT